jgi:HK97 family phage major capsid protein
MRTLAAIREDRERATERITALREEAAGITGRADTESRNLTDGEVERGHRLAAGIAKLQNEITALDNESRAAIGEIASRPGNREEIVDAPARTVPASTGTATRDAALRTIEAAVRSSLLPDHAAEKATALVETGNLGQREVAARWVDATGDPQYLGAFSKLVGDPTRGHLLWTAQEQAAYQRVAHFQAERAMSLTDSAGGFMVPFTLDPSIILSSNGSINPLRRISRVVQTATDSWNGVSSAGVTAEWLTEATQAADASPTLAQPSVPLHKGSAFVPYSFEVGMNAVGFVAELSRLLTDGADQLQATAYTTGTGSDQPTGIITALAGGSSVVSGGGSEAYAVGDPVLVQNALPPRFQDRAQWCANLAIINATAAFETTAGALRYPEVANDRLLRKPLNELSNMDGAIDAAATATNHVLLYGDFSNFVIADGIGTTIELIPNLVGDNHRPTGQRGLFMWFRTGSDSVNDAAFRVLNVATTA